MRKKFSHNRGLIKTVVLVIAGLILLAYLGLNLRSIVESQTFIDNWEFIKNLMVTIWSDYLKGPILYIFNNIFMPYIWEPLIGLIRSKI